MLDLLIRGGTVYDGSGAEGVAADVAVRDGKIVAVGVVTEEALRVIDATGLAVTPGFIDSHSHSDNNILYRAEQKEKLQQGVTTSVAGQCGSSVVPCSPATPQEKLDRMTKFGRFGDICGSVADFVDTLKDKPLGANMVQFVGHGNLRRRVAGLENRPVTEQEIEVMQTMLAEAFRHGAAGLSFGLFYAPGCYSSTEEAIALAKVAAQWGRPVSAHIRSEGDALIEAVEEFIAILRESGARGILSHHKAVRKRNWGKVVTTLQMMQAAVDEGIDIYSDTYPYNASSTTFSMAFVPKTWRAGGTDALLEKIRDAELCKANKEAYLAKDGEDMSWVLVTRGAGHPEYEGLRLDEIAKRHGKDGFDTAMDLILDSRDACSACFFSTCEEDLERVIGWHRTMICTDSAVASGTASFHPRMVGSFPRALSRYVRERQVVSLAEMVRKMTSLPAHVYGLTTKGHLQPGFDADICIFDPRTIQDHADFQNCAQKATGLAYVIVAGQVAAEDGVSTGICAGSLL